MESPAALRACFVMEQQLGHKTYYQNLRRYVDADPRMQARWVEVTYWQSDGWPERSPLIDR